MKFKLTTETRVWFGKTLYRIEALIDFGSVKSGERGGFVEAEKNLDQDGNAWVYGNARVYGDALVSGNALVFGNARVSGDAQVYGNARVSGNALVSPVHIIGLPYSVTIIDKHMQIGCEFHEITEWVDFDERRIAAMDGVRSSRFWRDHGPMLIGLCRTMRPEAFSPSSAQEVR